MRYLAVLAGLCLLCNQINAQADLSRPASFSVIQPILPVNPAAGKINVNHPERWRLNGNRRLTGGLMLLAGAAKGFNETLQFNWKGFSAVFPKANPQWFWPGCSFKNKYKDGDPAKGAKFPLSTSVLVMLTDQYHLNNFIQRASITTAIVLKIGKGKKPFKQYLFDALYYTGCYQVGFATVYYPFKWRN